MDKPNFVRTTNGETINLNHATSIAANTDPRYYDIQLANGKFAQISKHTAVNAVPHGQLPTPHPIAIPAPGQELPYQTDAQWLTNEQRKVGRVIDILKE